MLRLNKIILCLVLSGVTNLVLAGDHKSGGKSTRLVMPAWVKKTKGVCRDGLEYEIYGGVRVGHVLLVGASAVAAIGLVAAGRQGKLGSLDGLKAKFRINKAE